MLIVDTEPDLITPTTYAHCTRCEMDVAVVRRDFSFAYEYWGSKGVHADHRDCCSECGDEL